MRSYLLAALIGVAAALLGVAVPVAVGIAAASLAAALIVSSVLAGRAPAGGVQATRPSRADTWLDRMDRAIASFDELVGAATPGPLAADLGDLRSRASAIAERERHLADEFRDLEAAGDPKAAERLIHREERLSRALATERDASIRRRLTDDLARVRAEIARTQRLAGDARSMQSRIENTVLGLEGLVAHAAELVALPDAVRSREGDERVEELRGELFALEGVLSDAPEPSLASAPSVEPAVDGADSIGAVFRLEGDYWAIGFHGPVFRVHDAKGLRYIRRLLESPGVEVHVLDLVRGVEGADRSQPVDVDGEGLTVVTQGPGEPVIDSRAAAEYRRRAEELRAEIEEADANNDVERAARAREELDWLLSEFERSRGIGGVTRRMPSDVDRSRVNVTRAIKASILKIREHDTSLAHHLDHDIRTGTFCSYMPDPAATPAWRF